MTLHSHAGVLMPPPGCRHRDSHVPLSRRHAARGWPAVVAAATLAVGACGEAAPTLSGERDESGIEARWIRDRGADGKFFAQIIGAVELAGGVIAVADHMASTVHLFSLEGDPVASVGGVGSGPGEFRDLTAIGAAGEGTAWIFDRTLRRVTWINTHGDVVRTAPLDTETASWASIVIGELPSGGLVIVERVYPQPRRIAGNTTFRDSTLIVAFVPGADTQSVIGRFPLFDVTQGRNASGPTASVHPHGPRLQVAVDRTGRGILVGFSDTPEIRRVSEGGVERERLTVPVTPRRPSPAEIAAVAAQRARSKVSIDAFAEAPEQMPLFGRLLPGEAEVVWVEMTVEPGVRPQWMIMEGKGRPPRVITLAMGFHLLGVHGDRLLGVLRDEDGGEAFMVATLSAVNERNGDSTGASSQ